MYSIEVGFGKSDYEVKMTTDNKAQAWAVYNKYHVHSGGKKRLIFHKGRKRVLARIITHKY